MMSIARWISAGCSGMALLALGACGDGPQGDEPVIAARDEVAAPAAAASSAEPAETAAVGRVSGSASGPALGRFAPRDECGGLDGAPEFLAALSSAVSARDGDAMIALVDDEVMLDFGGGAGAQELRQRLVHPDWQLWEELDQMLALGCAVDDDGSMIIPWYFQQDIPGDDGYAIHIVEGEDVPLLAKPESGADVVRLMSWDSVELAESGGDSAEFAYVRTNDGTLGHVAWSALRGLIDYRMIVEPDNRGWRITVLISGD